MLLEIGETKKEKFFCSFFVTAAITKKMGNEVTHCVLFLFFDKFIISFDISFCCCLPSSSYISSFLYAIDTRFETNFAPIFYTTKRF
jgi:hypothetical protein